MESHSTDLGQNNVLSLKMCERKRKRKEIRRIKATRGEGRRIRGG